MVVDTSAIIAILFLEPEADRYVALLGAASVRLLSVVTRVELSFVTEGRKAEGGRRDLDRFLMRLDDQVVPATQEHAMLAVEAFRRFGNGRHRAALNIGDCFSYALAKASGYPLLYKGGDFAQTDIRSAI